MIPVKNWGCLPPDRRRGKTSFFEGTSYTSKVQQQMNLGDFHSFPESVTAFEDAGTVTPVTGADGQSYLWCGRDWSNIAGERVL
jgi:hypothetical protein